jgi:hypothetical protein
VAEPSSSAGLRSFLAEPFHVRNSHKHDGRKKNDANPVSVIERPACDQLDGRMDHAKQNDPEDDDPANSPRNLSNHRQSPLLRIARLASLPACANKGHMVLRYRKWKLKYPLAIENYGLMANNLD